MALILLRFGNLVRPESPASVWLWVGLLAVATIAGFTAWARALDLAGREGVPHVNKLPYWLRRGWAIASLGLIAPGSGLLLSGHRGRAALSLWLLWPAATSVVILLNVSGLWKHHQVSGWLASSGPALETTFLIAGAVVALGFLGHIAQALEGMRQVLVEPGLKTKVKGDYYALAVVAMVVVLIVAADPVQMAHQLDVGGDLLRDDGYQVIPLQLTKAASRLDPAKSEYVLQTIALYEELGQTEKAAVVRDKLDQNLGTYVALRQKETVAEFGLAPEKSKAASRPRPSAMRPADSVAVAADAVKEPADGSKSPVKSNPVNMNPLAFLGSIGLGEDTAAVATDTTAQGPVRPVRSVRKTARAMGMPMGLPLPLSDADSSARQKSAPQK